MATIEVDIANPIIDENKPEVEAMISSILSDYIEMKQDSALRDEILSDDRFDILG